MTAKKKHLITAALPYANGALHLGHLAGAYLPADIYARYLRLMGKEVLFVCGSDEHGAAITIRAKKDGVSPQEIIDTYHHLNKDTFEKLGISFDIYHRTSEPLHHETAQDFFKKLYELGTEFEERTTEQYYDEAYDQFLADRYITGTCPRCGHEEAYGDQCESCGATLSPTELLKPRSVLSGETPSLRATKHWYFRLDQHADWLREFIQSGTLNGKPHHDAAGWRKHVVGQCLSWLDGGLQPRAITRDLDWGIPVPLEDAEGKVLYVWFDAPIGYISATRQWALDHGKDWKDYWKNPDTELTHFIGKDNIVFHCIVFPAMLKAHGEYNLPTNVPANQFLNFEGRKFSKSKGWGVEQHEYLELFSAFPNKEDALRFALTRNMPEGKDSDFRWDDFVESHDKDLADNLGNFINRVAVLSKKYFDGAVPEAGSDTAEVLKPAYELAESVCRSFEAFQFRQATQSILELCSYGNTYLQDQAPWSLYKENPEHPDIAACMHNSLQMVSLLSVLWSPIIPFSTQRIRRMLNLPELKAGDLQVLRERMKNSDALLPAGHHIGEPEILFAKINDRRDTSRMELIEAQKANLAALLAAEEAAAPKTPAIKPLIEFDDFSKLDLRTGCIVAAEKVPKADKLLKLTVDLGSEQRCIVSGIAQYFSADEALGKQVVVVANLAPRKLRGIESQGMILMAENAAGELGFVGADSSWPAGFPVR